MGTVSFQISGISYYDFASSLSAAFGNNQIQVSSNPDYFAFYSGDTNQDGIIDVADVVDVFNDVNNFTSGYVSTDVNGDNFVDVSDLLITYNNANNVVSVITP